MLEYLQVKYSRMCKIVIQAICTGAPGDFYLVMRCDCQACCTSFFSCSFKAVTTFCSATHVQYSQRLQVAAAYHQRSNDLIQIWQTAMFGDQECDQQEQSTP